MKKSVLFMLFLCVTLLLSACSDGTEGGDAKDTSSAQAQGAEADSKELIIGTSSNSGDLDPACIAIDKWVEYSKLCIDPLISYDEAGNIIYEGAESYEVSEDQLTWTFHLREDGKWSDGSAVTADDFINTIHRSLNPDNPRSIYGSMLYPIVGAAEAASGQGALEDIAAIAVDPYTLEITLSDVCPYFLKLITLPPFNPSKAGVATLENETWATTPETSLGNGAFYMTEYVQDQYYVLSKNPYYHKADAVKLDQIKVQFIMDNQAMISAYKTGEINVAVGLPSFVMEEYADSDELFIWNMLTTKFILPNIQVEPMDDVNVRKAIALALNRSEICAVVGADYIPTTSFVAEYMLSNATSEYFSQEGAPLFEENVEEAKQLLVDAGYPDGEGFPELIYNYPNSEKDAAIAQAIQAQLKANLNIDLTLNAAESQVNVSDRREGNFMMTRHSWTADFNDPINYLSLYTSDSGNNDSHISNAAYDDYIAQSNTELDQAKRNEYLHLAEETLVADNFYVIPINTQIYIGLRNTNVTGTAVNDKGETMYRYADMD